MMSSNSFNRALSPINVKNKSIIEDESFFSVKCVGSDIS